MIHLCFILGALIWITGISSLLSNPSNCTILGYDLSFVDNTCFTLYYISKISSAPVSLKWTIPLCNVPKNCTAIPRTIERNGKTIARYLNASWKTVTFESQPALTLNYSRYDAVPLAIFYFICEVGAYSPHITMDVFGDGEGHLYQIVVAHHSLCPDTNMSLPTIQPTVVHTSFPTPSGVYYFVTRFDVNITWAADIDETPDQSLIMNSLIEAIHVIVTSGLSSSAKDKVHVAVEEKEIDSMSIKTNQLNEVDTSSIDQLDMHVPWVVHAIIQSDEEAAVFKIEKALRKIQKNHGELVGMLVERDVNYIDDIELINIISNTTSVDFASEMARHSPARILWIILGTVCLFAIFVMGVQKLIECSEELSLIDHAQSFIRAAHARIATRFDPKNKSRDRDEIMDGDDGMEYEEQEDTTSRPDNHSSDSPFVERRPLLLQQRK